MSDPEPTLVNMERRQLIGYRWPNPLFHPRRFIERLELELDRISGKLLVSIGVGVGMMASLMGALDVVMSSQPVLVRLLLGVLFGAFWIGGTWYCLKFWKWFNKPVPEWEEVADGISTREAASPNDTSASTEQLLTERKAIITLWPGLSAVACGILGWISAQVSYTLAAWVFLTAGTIFAAWPYAFHLAKAQVAIKKAKAADNLLLRLAIGVAAALVPVGIIVGADYAGLISIDQIKHFSLVLKSGLVDAIMWSISSLQHGSIAIILVGAANLAINELERRINPIVADQGSIKARSGLLIRRDAELIFREISDVGFVSFPLLPWGRLRLNNPGDNQAAEFFLVRKKFWESISDLTDE